jgi:rRNA maturation endonuclease Nob1
MTLIGLFADFFSQEESKYPYECCECGRRFSVQHHCCPECDGYSIERVVWQTGTD